MEPESRQFIQVHILKRHVPTWIGMLVLGGIVGGTLWFGLHYRRTVEYSFFLPGPDLSSTPFTYGSWPALHKESFFKEVKAKLITDGGNFIEADLSAMKLRVFQGGVAVKEVNIVSKGREGSWWETPAGIYRITAKEEKHFSSFGRVFMPWSMPFQGNFFIHGWPYYQDGTPVSAGYSGGCIRLNNTDAEAVFRLASVGMPIIVGEKDSEGDQFTYVPRIPESSARAYLVADLKSNFVLTERNTEESVPIASLTKLMTAMVSIEFLSLEKEIFIESSMLVPTSISRLKAGESRTVYDLLALLLNESSNEAATTLASALGRKRFVELMNEKASAIGMLHTKFVDPSGSGEGNVSTAKDLFTLAQYIYHNRIFIFRMTSGKEFVSAYGKGIFGSIKNFNLFSENKYFIGGKVGKTTAAQETIVSVFELPIQENTRPIVFIVLGTENVEREVSSFLTWTETRY